MTLEEAKSCVGKKARYFNIGEFEITEVRQLESGMILAYNEHNWCCNIEILKIND